MMQRKSRASDTSKLPEEFVELLNGSSDDLPRTEVEEFRQFLHEFKDVFAVQEEPTSLV